MLCKEAFKTFLASNLDNLYYSNYQNLRDEKGSNLFFMTPSQSLIAI
jgi:hypothetical protein